VARPKRVITQRDFSAGELREEFLERDDVGLRKASLKRAANTFIGPTQTIAARPGSTYLRTAPNVRHMIEIRPTTTDTFALLLLDDGIRVVTEAGTSIFFTGAVSWTSASQCWAVPLGAETIIGHPTEGIYVLSYSDGVFYYGDFTFAEGSDNRTLQPYYKFAGGSKITPSASTGAVTVTATGNFFRPETVGTKIRYGEREIEVTGYVSNTSVTGTVVSTLPPCFRLTVASTANLNVDDVVIGQDSGFNGVITSVDSSTTFSVLTIDNWDGPTLNEKITSPQVTQTITAITAIGPQASSF
jgi:hypothetical protein